MPLASDNLLVTECDVSYWGCNKSPSARAQRPLPPGPACPAACHCCGLFGRVNGRDGTLRWQPSGWCCLSERSPLRSEPSTRDYTATTSSFSWITGGERCTANESTWITQ